MSSQQSFIGTSYNGAVALLVGALISIPVLLLFGPLGFPSELPALYFSGLCIAAAWHQWKTYADTTVLSLVKAERVG